MIYMAFMPLYMWGMWDVTPVTHGHTDGQWESRAVFSLSWIRNIVQTNIKSAPVVENWPQADHHALCATSIARPWTENQLQTSGNPAWLWEGWGIIVILEFSLRFSKIVTDKIRWVHSDNSLTLKPSSLMEIECTWLGKLATSTWEAARSCPERETWNLF